MKIIIYHYNNISSPGYECSKAINVKNYNLLIIRRIIKNDQGCKTVDN